MPKPVIGLLYSGNKIGKEEKLFLSLAKEKNIELIMFNLSSDIDEDKFEKEVKRCDVIYNNTAEDYVVEFIKTIEELGKKVIDSSKAYYYPEDKWIFYLKCKKNKIPTPETILLSEHLDVAKKELEEFGKWPVVIKRIYGSMGQYVKKADNIKSAVEQIKQLWKKGSERLPIIAQELIPSSSYRVTVIDGKIVQTALKKSNGWKATGNYAKKFYKFDIDQKLKKIVNKVINISKIKVCGIDLLRKKDDWFVIEVNSEPDFSFFENEQKKLVGIMLNFLKKEAIKSKTNHA